jgi:hypothetical protein
MYPYEIDPSSPSSPYYEHRIVLEKIRLATVEMFSKDVFESVDAEWFADEVARRIHLRVKAGIFAEHAKTYQVKYPTDWWQHFKLRWFPKRLRDRYPVQYHVERFDAKIVYRDFKPSFPDKQPYVIWQVKGGYGD